MTNLPKTIMALTLFLCFAVGLACAPHDKRCKQNAKKIKELRKNNPNFTM